MMSQVGDRKREKEMSIATKAAVWIDHHKAVVVIVDREGERFVHVASGREAVARSRGDAKVKSAYARDDFVAENRRQRKSISRLDEYYDEVIACLSGVEAVFVLGPGEAKEELANRFNSKKRKGRIAHLGTLDKMTDREIVSHVRGLLCLEGSDSEEAIPSSLTR